MSGAGTVAGVSTACAGSDSGGTGALSTGTSFGFVASIELALGRNPAFTTAPGSGVPGRGKRAASPTRFWDWVWKSVLKGGSLNLRSPGKSLGVG